MNTPSLTEHITVKTVSETPVEGTFEIEGLYAGYGVTLGNALRRILLSSLPGAAITQAKIKGVGHKFTTIPGVLEDVVELSLSLKKIRFLLVGDEPQVLHCKVKGDSEVFAKDFEPNAQALCVTPDVKIATLTDKKAELDIEVTVERGMGYSPVEERGRESVPIGVLLIDAIFSPVIHVDFKEENMRVGDRIDYNRLRLSMKTDGAVSPSGALKQALMILAGHCEAVASKIEVKEAEMPAVASEKPKKKSLKKVATRDRGSLAQNAETQTEDESEEV
jgi:DNA-directed RNA polymerase subunit alpha